MWAHHVNNSANDVVNQVYSKQMYAVEIPNRYEMK